MDYDDNYNFSGFSSDDFLAFEKGDVSYYENGFNNIFIDDIIRNTPSHLRVKVKSLLLKFHEICEKGDRAKVEEALKYHIPDHLLYKGLFAACKTSQTKIIECLLKKGAKLNKDIISYICKNGLLDAIKTLRLHIVYDNYLGDVCSSGNLEAVKYFVQEGNIINFDKGLTEAADINIALYMIKQGATTHKIRSMGVTFQLLFHGYEIDNYHVDDTAKEAFLDKKKAIVKQYIYDLNIPLYDDNITGIMCDYLSYGPGQSKNEILFSI